MDLEKIKQQFLEAMKEKGYDENYEFVAQNKNRGNPYLFFICDENGDIGIYDIKNNI